MDINAVRITLSVNALSQTDATNGNISGYQVAYQIQLSVDGGAYTTVVNTSFNGKASSTYTRSHRIELAGAKSLYTVRVVRTTPDTTSEYIQDVTNIVSFSELIDAQLRYPGSAVVGLTLDASQFASVPTRSYHMKGLLIKYPSNYNPDTRTYAGTWDGTFVTGYTNNPAWIFYDLVLNTRYGAGRWVDASMIDRYALYTIAQYCDVMVSDGMGGLEPRFACNCYIATRAGAFQVLQDLASVFRGMAYWAAGQVVATADMPLDSAYTYTAANTTAAFKYVGSSLNTRYTAAQVTWNDPQNAYQQAVEYVEDADGVARYGINQAELVAFGCTSRGQAQRVGHWTLLTSRYETQVVTIELGLDGTVAQPGQIVAVADPSRAGRRIGGRIRAVSGTNQITLDRALPEAKVGDTLTVMMPTGVPEKQPIGGVNGAVITVGSPFSSQPVANAVWMIESSTLQAQLFRVSTVADKGGIAFEVTGTQYEPSKYAAIDTGAAIDVRPITGSTLTVQTPPTGVTVTQNIVIDQGIAKTDMYIYWTAAPNAVGYTVQWQKDNGDWVVAGTTGGLSMDIPGIYSGSYLARVCAINAMGITSPYAYSTLTQLAGKTGAPPVVTSLAASTALVFSVQVGWSFPPNAGDTAYTEVYYSHTSDFSTAVSLGQFSYPTSSTSLLGLSSGYKLFFWARLIDTTGNVGAFYPAITDAGIAGSSSADADAILGYLTGQITATQLSQDLLSPIESIPGLQTSVAAAQSAITQETTDRVAAINAEATTRAAAILAEATARGTAVTNETTARTAADTALGQRIDTVTATTGSNVAAIQAETTARTTADTALGSRIDTVVASTGANAAAIGTETTARTNADSALGSRIDTLSTTTGANTAAITAEQTARTNADSAQVTATNALSSRVDAANSAITSEASTRAAADSSLATQIDSLSAQIVIPEMAGDPSDFAGATTVYAGLWSEQSARAEADLALADQVNTVTAQITTATSSMLAAVQTETQARVDADSAAAAVITDVQAQVADNTAAVQTNAASYADINGRVSASYQIKTQVTANGQTYIAGIGIGVDNDSGILESQVIISASRFSVVDPNGPAAISPFVIQGGQVLLSQAMIGTAWITNGMIGDTIQSTTTNDLGQPSWIISKSGGITLNGPPGTGYQRLTLVGGTLAVYDANNVLRVRLGLW
nr:phage tail protein [Pararobbsia alpina]